MILRNAFIFGALVMQMTGSLGQPSTSAMKPSSINLEKYAELVGTHDLSNTGMIEISTDEATKLIGKNPNVSILGGAVPQLNINSIRVYQVGGSSYAKKNVIEILQFGFGAAAPLYFLDEK